MNWPTERPADRPRVQGCAQAGIDRHSAQVTDAALARLSQLAVASLQIGPFYARKCLVGIGRKRQSACSEDFGRCGGWWHFVECGACSCAANAARRTARSTSTGAWWRTAAWPTAAWPSVRCSTLARSTPASARRGARPSRSAIRVSGARWRCFPRAACRATTSMRWACARALRRRRPLPDRQ
jgi:hypothetical protein